MEALLKEHFEGINVELARGHSGIYDIRLDDEMIFSKNEAGRFPEDQELLDAIRSMRQG